jgi:hypothetical protein
MCLDCGCLEPDNDHGDPDAHITMADLQAAADADSVSAAQAAANIVTTVTLMAAGELPGGATDQAAAKAEICAVNIIKTVPARQYSLGPAYPAMVAPGKGADGFNDFISEDALEKAAWSWMTKSRQIGLFHQDGLEGHATVVESYIYRGPDWHVVSPVDKQAYVIKSGTWMLGTVWDSHGWELVERGLVNGWSPEGAAQRAIPTPERLAQLGAG